MRSRAQGPIFLTCSASLPPGLLLQRIISRNLRALGNLIGRLRRTQAPSLSVPVVISHNACKVQHGNPHVQLPVAVRCLLIRQGHKQHPAAIQDEPVALQIQMRRGAAGRDEGPIQAAVDGKPGNIGALLLLNCVHRLIHRQLGGHKAAALLDQNIRNALDIQAGSGQHGSRVSKGNEGRHPHILCKA